MISCMKEGKPVYINRIEDFDEVVDHSVFEAIKEFCGENIGDRRPADVIEHLENRIYDLKYENDKYEEEQYELKNERDDLSDELDELKEKYEKLKEMIKPTAEMMEEYAEHTEKVRQAMQILQEELED